MSVLLPIHGFVLAGGKSSRMGRDKALLEVNGRSMVESSVARLRGFCAEVSIVGNRDDLSEFAPVVREKRVSQGPAAGFEAGLKACTQPWALFTPVDTPLLPAELLRRWAEATVAHVPECDEVGRPLMSCSLYTTHGDEPVFAIVRPEAMKIFTDWLDRGERRLSTILGEIGTEFGHARSLRVDAANYVDAGDRGKLELWFANLNTPEDVAAASNA